MKRRCFNAVPQDVLVHLFAVRVKTNMSILLHMDLRLNARVGIDIFVPLHVHVYNGVEHIGKS